MPIIWQHSSFPNHFFAHIKIKVVWLKVRFLAFKQYQLCLLILNKNNTNTKQKSNKNTNTNIKLLV